ncbi:MAG: F-box-like domain-containing protein [Anaerolineae bacterium]
MFSLVPIEVKNLFFSFLPLEDLLTMSRVNKEFYELSQREELWKNIGKMLLIEGFSGTQNPKKTLLGRISQAHVDIQRVIFSMNIKPIVVKNLKPSECYLKTLDIFFAQCPKKEKREVESDVENINEGSADSGGEAAVIKISGSLVFEPFREVEDESILPENVDLKEVLRTFNLDIVRSAFLRGVKVEQDDLLFFLDTILGFLLDRKRMTEKIEKLERKLQDDEEKLAQIVEQLKQTGNFYTSMQNETGKVVKPSERLQFDSFHRPKENKIEKKRDKIEKRLEKNKEKLKKSKEDFLTFPSLGQLKEQTVDITTFLIQSGVRVVVDREGSEEKNVGMEDEDIPGKTLILALEFCNIFKDPSLLNVLIEAGAKLSSEESEGNVLNRALSLNNSDLVKFIIARGGNPSSEGFAHLIITDNVELLKILLEANFRPGPEFFQHLLKLKSLDKIKKFDESLNGDWGGTTLDEVIESKDLEVVKWALDKKFSLTSSTLTQALRTGDKKIIQLMLGTDATGDEDSFAEAFQLGDIEVLQDVMKKGAPPPTDGHLFYQAIKKVAKGQIAIEMVRFMVYQAGLKTDKRHASKTFNKALKHVLKKGERELLVLAKEAGAFPNKKTQKLLKDCQDEQLIKFVKEIYSTNIVR